jgi:hypothetical protein
MPNVRPAWDKGELGLAASLRLLHCREQLVAGLLAAPADLGADPAVLVHLRVPRTLVPTAAAATTHASNSGRVTLASYSVWRLTTRSVAVHTSAQSRSRRMHLVRSATFGSLRQSSAQAVQAWAQSDWASMAA